MKNLIITIALIITSTFGFSQSSQLKQEALLTSKKWTCMQVKRKKLEKADFKFEMGNKLKFEIDKKYQYENNDYNYSAGEWKLDKKMLYFFYVDPKGNNRKISATYKVLKLSDSQLILKRLDRPKGKLVFK
ncbi:MAG: hypothetical protein ACPGD5_07525 [Salibacteraceae bacterium]